MSTQKQTVTDSGNVPSVEDQLDKVAAELGWKKICGGQSDFDEIVRRFVEVIQQDKPQTSPRRNRTRGREGLNNMSENINKANLAFKLRRFAALVEAQTIERLKADDLSCEANILNAKTNFHIGRKYSRVDVGSSGKYMIDNQTEEIFAIKGYGVIHKGHRFGTLDTTDKWHWGEYRAIRKNLAA